MTMDAATCPECGAKVPDSGPDAGLCTRCLVSLALDESMSSSPEPGGKGWSKTYSSFGAVQSAALAYLQGLARQLEAKETRDAREERLLKALKARGAEIEKLTLRDLPAELLNENHYDEAYERARYEVEMQRAARRPYAAGVFLLIGLVILLASLLGG